MRNVDAGYRRIILRVSISGIQRRQIWTRIPPGVDKIPPEQVLVQDNRSYRVRQHGNRPLPLPPLLDDIVESARTKYQAAKPAYKSSDLTEFQKTLANNTYGNHAVLPSRPRR